MGNKYTVTAGNYGRTETYFGTEYLVVALYHLLFKVSKLYAHKELRIT